MMILPHDYLLFWKMYKRANNYRINENNKRDANETNFQIITVFVVVFFSILIFFICSFFVNNFYFILSCVQFYVLFSIIFFFFIFAVFVLRLSCFFFRKLFESPQEIRAHLSVAMFHWTETNNIQNYWSLAMARYGRTCIQLRVAIGYEKKEKKKYWIPKQTESISHHTNKKKPKKKKLRKKIFLLLHETRICL